MCVFYKMCVNCYKMCIICNKVKFIKNITNIIRIHIFYFYDNKYNIYHYGYNIYYKTYIFNQFQFKFCYFCTIFLLLLFWNRNLHYTHAYSIWGEQRWFESPPNWEREFPSTTGQMPSGLLHHNSKPGTKSKATVKRTNHPGRHLWLIRYHKQGSQDVISLILLATWHV